MFLDKETVIAMHQGEFDWWERLLDTLSAAQRMEHTLPDGLTVKDTIAHLTAWQKRTIARLEAGLYGHEPRFPQWPVALEDEETEKAVDRANAWIYEVNRNRPWADVYQEWRDGFLRFLELVRAVSETDLAPGGKLAWVADYYPLEGYADTLDHHHAEHRVQLEPWLRELGGASFPPMFFAPGR